MACGTRYHDDFGNLDWKDWHAPPPAAPSWQQGRREKLYYRTLLELLSGVRTMAETFVAAIEDASHHTPRWGFVIGSLCDLRLYLPAKEYCTFLGPFVNLIR